VDVTRSDLLEVLLEVICFLFYSLQNLFYLEMDVIHDYVLVITIQCQFHSKLPRHSLSETLSYILYLSPVLFYVEHLRLYPTFCIYPPGLFHVDTSNFSINFVFISLFYSMCNTSDFIIDFVFIIGATCFIARF
jgi:hypothetical protein